MSQPHEAAIFCAFSAKIADSGPAMGLLRILCPTSGSAWEIATPADVGEASGKEENKPKEKTGGSAVP
jgi:hypothetical protein